MDISFPRINSSQLNINKGKTVRIIGTVKSIQNNQLIISTSDNGQATVHMSQRPIYNVEDKIEVTGKVLDGSDIQEQMIYLLPPNMNFEVYEEFLSVIPKAQELFF